MRFVLTLLWFACVPRVDTNDLRRCDADDPAVDCCPSDDACEAYYGPEFPWCLDPGETTGRCVECRVDEDCDLDARCEEHPEYGAYCAPLLASESERRPG